MSRMRQKRKARGKAEASHLRAVPNEEVVADAEHASEDAVASAADDEHASGDDSVEPEPATDLEEQSEEARIDRLKHLIESLLLATEKPLTVTRMRQLIRERRVDRIQAAVDALVEDYSERGIVVHEVAGGYQLRTHPRNSSWVQQLVAGRPVRLTRAQLETLSIIAYRQPITRPEIDDIRGVDSGGTLKVLLERGIIRVLGKKEEPGRPLLYGTTKSFLEFFNLSSLGELPTLREYHELTEDSVKEAERLGVDVTGDSGEGVNVAQAEDQAQVRQPESDEPGAAAGDSDVVSDDAEASSEDAEAAPEDTEAGEGTDAAAQDVSPEGSQPQAHDQAVRE